MTLGCEARNSLSKTCNGLDLATHIPQGLAEPVGGEGRGAYKLEATGEDGGREDVGKRQTLTDKESVEGQVALDDTDGLESRRLRGVDVLLVVGVTADQRAEPVAEREEDLGVGVRHPLEDRGVVLPGLSEEGGLLVLGGD